RGQARGAAVAHSAGRGREAERERVGEQPERGDGRLVVGQRLAHPHVDDVRETPTGFERPGRPEHLADDLARAEIALETHGARVAEPAPEAAPDLREHKEREAAGAGHTNRLPPPPAADPETPPP